MWQNFKLLKRIFFLQISYFFRRKVLLLVWSFIFLFTSLSKFTATNILRFFHFNRWRKHFYSHLINFWHKQNLFLNLNFLFFVFILQFSLILNVPSFAIFCFTFFWFYLIYGVVAAASIGFGGDPAFVLIIFKPKD